MSKDELSGAGRASSRAPRGSVAASSSDVGVRKLINNMKMEPRGLRPRIVLAQYLELREAVEHDRQRRLDAWHADRDGSYLSASIHAGEAALRQLRVHLQLVAGSHESLHGRPFERPARRPGGWHAITSA